MTEDEIKAEMRLFALESLVCQHVATLYRMMPADLFEAVHKQAIEGARERTFPGADAAFSDLYSAELEAAVDTLYKMIKSQLEVARKIGL